ncbi:MAG: type III-A CRISPR-associated RAMP protein Csm3 [Tannerellaceae bacterium]|jgi:CRISPR-associated protein Csm3|nr:type III-A CRISPR-associated RAMP protein Csm3 [Tannerellaceae bacterium]
MTQLVKKIKVTTTLQLVTGLHIGGGSENVEIGGIDNPVIKIAMMNNQPYIPGSSIKGKMRCLLEQIAGTVEVGGGKRNAKTERQKKINRLFGYSEDNQPSKLIVRDAYLTYDSEEKLRISDNLDLTYTEIKFENTINRLTGTADNPRQTERIPAGVFFNVEFVINVWNYTDNEKKKGCENDAEEDLLALLKEGIRALENDYLGGSGSRGYGQIKFGELKEEDIKFDKSFEKAE